VAGSITEWIKWQPVVARRSICMHKNEQQLLIMEATLPCGVGKYGFMHEWPPKLQFRPAAVSSLAPRVRHRSGNMLTRSHQRGFTKLFQPDRKSRKTNWFIG
jgi:hypothetical protein